AWDEFVPHDVYVTGELWPKHDRAAARASAGDAQAAEQLRLLQAAIRPLVFEDIEHISPRHGWLPVSLVAGWMSHTLNRPYGRVELARSGGLLLPAGTELAGLEQAALSPEALWALGWMNHDRTIFRPTKDRDEKLDDARMRVAKEWDAS